MRRKILPLGAMGALVLAAAIPTGSASASPGGAVCQITGTAAFTPGLTLSPNQGAYSFSGQLTGCSGSDTSAPASASITASSNSPIDTGSCELGFPAAGTANVIWSDKTTSTVSYNATAVAAGVAVTGTVVDGRYNGDSLGGLLVFQTTSPQDCASTGGLTSATFTGAATFESAS